MNTISKYPSEPEAGPAARKRAVTIQALVVRRWLRAYALTRSRRSIGTADSTPTVAR